MATKALVSVDEYLRTSYEPDMEYVRGELVERGMPTKSHNKAGLAFIEAIKPLVAPLSWFVMYETRNRLEAEVFRIPDVAVWEREPEEDVPSQPPLIAVEILSPDDRMSNIREKCEEYRKWGVKLIWIIDPKAKVLSVYDAGFRDTDAFSIPEHNITIPASQIFN